MAKQTWSATLIVTTDNGERRDPSFSFHHADIVADGVEDAREKVFTWARKKLARFNKRDGRAIQIHAGPRIKSEGKPILDGTKMLRNRFKFGSLVSFMEGNNDAKSVFVLGYGPRTGRGANKVNAGRRREIGAFLFLPNHRRIGFCGNHKRDE